MAVPSAFAPSKVYFTLSPCDSTVRVKLLGGWPALYFDFSRLSFQVPTSALCASTVVAAAQTRTVRAANARRRFIFLSLCVTSCVAMRSGRLERCADSTLRTGEMSNGLSVGAFAKTQRKRPQGYADLAAAGR